MFERERKLDLFDCGMEGKEIEKGSVQIHFGRIIGRSLKE